MEWRGRARGQEDYRLRRRRRNWRTKRRPERGEPRGGEKKTRCKKQREREGGGKVEERGREREIDVDTMIQARERRVWSLAERDRETDIHVIIDDRGRN